MAAQLPRRFRNTRIVWTAFWLVVGGWVLSLWLILHFGLERRAGYSRYLPLLTNEVARNPIRKAIEYQLDATAGGIGLQLSINKPQVDFNRWPVIDIYGFHFQGGWNNCAINIPYWFVVATISALAVLPWLPWRRSFGTKALLIAMALIALFLGLFVAPAVPHR